MASVRGQKLNRLVELGRPQSEIAASTAEKVAPVAEQTLGPAAMGFDSDGTMLMVPESGEHGPTEA